MTDNKAEKRCSHCKQIKPITEFCRNRAMRDGINYRCKGCVREYVKKYHKTASFKKTHSKSQRKWNKTKKGRISQRLAARRYRENHPKEMAARSEVAKAVSRGEITPPKDFRCVHCSRKAKPYHHHKGYAKKHWLDVVPVCRQCHGKLDRPDVQLTAGTSIVGQRGKPK